MVTTFHVDHILDDPASFPHHQSISQLWATKWRAPCSKGIYPFSNAKLADFEPIFQQLIQISGDSTAILSDADQYAGVFLPFGKKLFDEAEEAEKNGQIDMAKDLFLRASAVYRIARFPVTRKESANNWHAWMTGKEAYVRAGKYFKSPIIEVNVPFTHANVDAGDLPSAIPTYLRIPEGDRPPAGWPLLLKIGGLDGYRTDFTQEIDQHLEQGFAVMAMEIPGTGDCPAARRDPTGADRWISSLVDWTQNEGKTDYSLDGSRIFARGSSTGGYYAVRLAYTHASAITASVAQSAWSHYALTPEWLSRVDNGEYPFLLAEAYAFKLGYDSVEKAIKSDLQTTFSLLENGLLDQHSAPLLLVNGTEDTIFPIEDSTLVCSYGSPKSLRLVPGVGHMGRPAGDQYILAWLAEFLKESHS